MRGVNGIHHITSIAGPETYHLFYADADGHPGSDLTFFPWAQMAPSRPGHGLAMEVGLEVPQDTLGYWNERLQRYGTQVAPPDTRFGEKVLAFTDPHGLKVALTEAPAGRPFTPWEGSPVPSEHQIRGLHGAQLWERDASVTARFLTDILGFLQLGTENGWTRYGFKGSAGVVDVRDRPDARRGGWGVGSVHHLAWRVDDEAHQAAARARVEAAGAHPTPVIDRFWFKSVYFKEPGGVLFELATDGPGFTADEPAETLGERLALPPFLEDRRAQIEPRLTPLPDAAALWRGASATA